MPKKSSQKENKTLDGDVFFEFLLAKNDNFEVLDEILSPYDFYDFRYSFGDKKIAVPKRIMDELKNAVPEVDPFSPRFQANLQSTLQLLLTLRVLSRRLMRRNNFFELFTFLLSPGISWKENEREYPVKGKAFEERYSLSAGNAEIYFVHARRQIIQTRQKFFDRAKCAIREFINRYQSDKSTFFESEEDVYHFILHQFFFTKCNVDSAVYYHGKFVGVVTAANKAFEEYNKEKPKILAEAVTELHELVQCAYDVESAKVVLANYKYVPWDSNTEIPLHLRTEFYGISPPFEVAPELCLKQGPDFIYEALEKFRIQGRDESEAAYKFCLLLGELRYTKYKLGYELLPIFDLVEDAHAGAMFFLGLRCPNQDYVEKRGGDYFEIWNDRRAQLIAGAAKKGHSVAVSYLELEKIDSYIYPKCEPNVQISKEKLAQIEENAASGDLRAIVTLIRISNVCNRKVSYFERLIEEFPCRESEYLLGRYLLPWPAAELKERGKKVLEKVASEGHVGALRLLAKHYHDTGEFVMALERWEEMMRRNLGMHYPTFEPELSANYVCLAALEECVRLGKPDKNLPDLIRYRDCEPIHKLAELPKILEFQQKDT